MKRFYQHLLPIYLDLVAFAAVAADAVTIKVMMGM
jgi:hypothetical protein